VNAEFDTVTGVVYALYRVLPGFL